MVYELKKHYFLNNFDINIICAKDKKNGIGKDGTLLWHIPKDLKWMKEHTIKHTIIMGKNTFQDILKYTKNKPLPNRRNIILSTQPNPKWPTDIEVYSNIENLFENIKQDEKIFILGGEKIFELFLPYARKLILTEVEMECVADTYFPPIKEEDYVEEFSQKEEDNGFEFTFKILKRLS